MQIGVEIILIYINKQILNFLVANLVERLIL